MPRPSAFENDFAYAGRAHVDLLESLTGRRATPCAPRISEMGPPPAGGLLETDRGPQEGVTVNHRLPCRRRRREWRCSIFKDLPGRSLVFVGEGHARNFEPALRAISRPASLSARSQRRLWCWRDQGGERLLRGEPALGVGRPVPDATRAGAVAHQTFFASDQLYAVAAVLYATFPAVACCPITVRGNCPRWATSEQAQAGLSSSDEAHLLFDDAPRPGRPRSNRSHRLITGPRGWGSISSPRNPADVAPRISSGSSAKPGAHALRAFTGQGPARSETGGR